MGKHTIAALAVVVTLVFSSDLLAQTVLTQSNDQNTIGSGLTPACAYSGTLATAENSYWRVYDLATALPNTDFRVEAIRMGVELTGTAPNNCEIRLWQQTSGTFPTGLRSQMGSTQVIVEPAAGAWTSSVQVFALDAPVNFTQNTQVIIEFRVLDAAASGAMFFAGSNAAGQTGIGYISAPASACGFTSPVDIKSLGFPDANMIIDMVGNGPEMDVQQPAATSIADGGTKNIGDVPVTGQPFTFTIANTGRDDLDLPGTPVVVAPVTGNPTVSVTTQPGATVSSPAGTTTFVVQVTPAGNGPFSFSVAITSGSSPLSGLDFNENPYNFTVTGNGTGGPNAPPAVSIPGASAWTNPSVGLYTLTLQPGATFAAALQVTDADGNSMTTTVTNPSTAITGLTTQPASIGTPTAGPLSLSWAGTADASNAPGDYDWSISISDGIASTAITARIIIVDVDTQHSATGGTGGAGVLGNPYTRTFAENDPISTVANICTVTDGNTGQTIQLQNPVRTGGTAPGGSGFIFQLAAGIVTVSPAATLVANDVGTNVYTMELSDGLGTPVTIYVTITVTAAPINNPPVVTVPLGSAWVDAGGGLFTLTVQPGAAFNDSLNVTDPTPDNMTVDVTNPGASITGLTVQPVDIPTPTAGTIVLTWTGTADATNTPTNYDWTINVDDGPNNTIITARIIIVDTDPQHAATGGTAGSGTSVSPYLASYFQGDPATLVVDLATVTDQNTGQTLILQNPVRTGGTAIGGSGFTFSLVGGVLSVAPSATLVANDVGTNIYTVEVSDTAGAPVVVHVTINVVGVSGAITITNGSPLPAGTENVVYTPVALVASGGTPTYTFSVISGNLPTGLTLSPAGQISGTPTSVAVFNFTVRVVDSGNDSATKAFSLTINAAGGGGSGGGGGGDSGGGCAAEAGGNLGWLALLGMLSLGAVAIRMRKA